MEPLQQESGPRTSPVEAAKHPAQRYVIRRLRRRIPEHDEPMSWLEAERVADLQGAQLARLAQAAGVDLVTFVSTLPVVRVERDPTLPDISTSYWDSRTQQWVIVVRAGDPAPDRRFNVLHEFKRILDHGHEPRLYDARYLYGLVQAEMAADHFASCALMPGKAVRTVLRDGADLRMLARQFNVTVQAATNRLSDLNLLAVITKHTERREL